MSTHFCQTDAPLFEEILRYIKKPLLPFHTPGHKAGRGLGEPWNRPGLLTDFDLTEISSFSWAKSLETAESLAAEFYQADCSFFLTQGASQGILAILLGAFAPGDLVLVARNCHCSVVNGLILAGLHPIFLEVGTLAGWEGITTGVTPRTLRRGIADNPDIKGFLMTNPTYQGLSHHLEVYRKILGERLLIVDEAHGGHFEWMGYPGFDACSGADIWVQGTHKILGSLTQTGMLHIKEKRVNPGRIRQTLKLISTTSPSYVLLASLDYNRRWLAGTGRNLFWANLPNIKELKDGFAALTGLETLSESFEKQISGMALTLDPWKVCLSFRNFGIDGFQAETLYQKEWGIQPEYADLDQVTFFIAPWQSRDDLFKLVEATRAICLKGSPLNEVRPLIFPSSIPEQVILPREAAFGLMEEIPICLAEGRVAADIVSPYPPGIPLWVPGERIRQEELNYITMILKYGGHVNGVSSGKVFVVK